MKNLEVGEKWYKKSEVRRKFQIIKLCKQIMNTKSEKWYKNLSEKTF